MTAITITLIAALLLVASPLLVCAVLFLSFLPIWIEAKSAAIPLDFLQLIGIRLRGLEPNLIKDSLIRLHKAGIQLDSATLETHALAGGSLRSVTDGMITANKAGLDLSFSRIAAIDLAGRNVTDALGTIIQPKVLVCPDRTSGEIMGVAKDGVRVSAKVRITVRANIDTLVGGAGEATIVARVGEGIVAAIGSVANHKQVLEQPALISQYILGKGLDRGTAFEILSIDVSDVDVVDNVGARLQEIQAEVDKEIAQAKAEMRRVAAVALEREMKARIVAMDAQVTQARASVPRMMARSFRGGRIWINARPLRGGFGRILWQR